MERTVLAGIALLGASSIFAATPIDLSHFTQLNKISNLSQIKETSRMMGPKHKLHVRVQQEYKGYPVFGGDAVLHYANGKESAKAKMNGTFYQFLERDLKGAPAHLFTDAQADKALQTMINAYLEKDSKGTISHKESKMMVYVDSNKKAHFIYHVSFLFEPEDTTLTPILPAYLVDAESFKVYEEWNDLHAADAKAVPEFMELTLGGGLGGNPKTGQKSYDNAAPQMLHENSFIVSRDVATSTCYMQNSFSKVKSSRLYLPQPGQLMNFPCKAVDSNHNGLYWNEAFDQIGDSPSPANDAMHNIQTVRDMFMNWYHVPVLGEKNGVPASLTTFIHYGMSNAFYLGGILSIGDGIQHRTYPFTTRDIMSHEISHVFTEQHSKLLMKGAAGGLSEAFGDLTAKAAEMYVTGRNSWDFAADVVVYPGEALRYMDKPSKDCVGKFKRTPCSVDDMSQYTPTMDTHQLAGIFNRAFYLWATMPDWNVKLVYEVLVIANMQYWTSNVNFEGAACGIVSAAQDLGYDTDAPVSAFKQVGIDATHCNDAM